EVHRHSAHDVQPLAPEEPVGLDLQHYDDVAFPLRPLPAETQLRAVLGARGYREHQALLDPPLAAAAAGVAPLPTHPASASAPRTRAIHGEPALPERNHATPPALRTGG